MFFNQPIKITRQKPGKYVKGVWQPGDESTFTVQTSVQPTGKNDADNLPEGRRQDQSYALYTAIGQPLKAADDGSQTQSDRAEIYGDIYEVMHTEQWQNGLIPHHRTLVVKEADQ